MSLYICSECGLRVGDPDQEYCDVPSQLCPTCYRLSHPTDYDDDELGLDPEEEYDA